MFDRILNTLLILVNITLLTFTCSKSITETQDKDVKYHRVSIVDFEQANILNEK